MASIDPMVGTYSMKTPKVSKKIYPISGILCSVYGLDELPPQAKEVSCLYLMHPRLCTMDSMEGVANLAVADWNRRLQEGTVAPEQTNKGLIALSFDQRNHGTRLADKLSNEAWRQGNPKHAQDMWTTFQGTARDVPFLIDYLDSYVFPSADRKITNNLVLGVSLGGHAAWSCILHEPRISSATIIVGCPDYINLMTDRARLSKLPSWTRSSPPGSEILGSEAFPHAFVKAVRRSDPAGLFLSKLNDPVAFGASRNVPIRDPTEAEQQAIRPLMERSLSGKKILLMSGGSDKLVPYHKGEHFLAWLKKAIAPGGWYADGAVSLDDRIYEGVGHEVRPDMVEQAVQFIGETLAAGESQGKTGTVRTSKM